MSELGGEDAKVNNVQRRWEDGNKIQAIKLLGLCYMIQILFCFEFCLVGLNCRAGYVIGYQNRH